MHVVVNDRVFLFDYCTWFRMLFAFSEPEVAVICGKLFAFFLVESVWGKTTITLVVQLLSSNQWINSCHHCDTPGNTDYLFHIYTLLL